MQSESGDSRMAMSKQRLSIELGVACVLGVLPFAAKYAAFTLTNAGLSPAEYVLVTLLTPADALTHIVLGLARGNGVGATYTMTAVDVLLNAAIFAGIWFLWRTRRNRPKEVWWWTAGMVGVWLGFGECLSLVGMSP